MNYCMQNEPLQYAKCITIDVEGETAEKNDLVSSTNKLQRKKVESVD